MPNIRVLGPGQLDDPIMSDKFDDWRTLLVDSGKYKFDHMNLNFIWEYLDQIISKKDDDRIMKHFLDLIDVSYRVGLQPHTLGSTNCSWPYALGYEFFTDGSGILQDGKPLIARLTSISFSLGTRFYSRGVEFIKQEAKERRMHKFLYAAPRLRSLSLSFMCDDLMDSEFGTPEQKNHTGLFSLLDIVGHKTIWKHLRTFRLLVDYVKPEELAHFLIRHSNTLEEFEMDVQNILGGLGGLCLTF
ncbi:hypothetical protein RUND412_002078 [Rhizina undulata]